MKKIAFLLTLIFFANVAFADSYTIEVDGMKCQYCAKHLENELQTLDGINSVKVDVETKLVQIDLANGQTLQEDQLKKTIKNAGFSLVRVVEPAT